MNIWFHNNEKFKGQHRGCIKAIKLPVQFICCEKINLHFSIRKTFRNILAGILLRLADWFLKVKASVTFKNWIIILYYLDRIYEGLEAMA